MSWLLFLVPLLCLTCVCFVCLCLRFPTADHSSSKRPKTRRRKSLSQKRWFPTKQTTNNSPVSSSLRRRQPLTHAFSAKSHIAVSRSISPFTGERVLQKRTVRGWHKHKHKEDTDSDDIGQCVDFIMNDTSASDHFHVETCVDLLKRLAVEHKTEVPLLSSLRWLDWTRLRENTYLNDEIVNAFMQLIQAKCNASDSSFPTVFALSSFFYETLYSSNSKSNAASAKATAIGPFIDSRSMTSEEKVYDYTRVRRWTKAANLRKAIVGTAMGGHCQYETIFDFDAVFFPVHSEERNHWMLAVIFMRQKRIVLLDSLSVNCVTAAKLKQRADVSGVRNGGRFLMPPFAAQFWDNIQLYLRDEFKDKIGSVVDDCELDAFGNDLLDGELFSFEYPLDIPQQRNAFDCGVFSCAFAHKYLIGLDDAFWYRSPFEQRSWLMRTLLECRCSF